MVTAAVPSPVPGLKFMPSDGAVVDPPRRERVARVSDATVQQLAMLTGISTLALRNVKVEIEIEGTTFVFEIDAAGQARLIAP